MNRIRGWLALHGLRLWVGFAVQATVIAIGIWGVPDASWLRIALFTEAGLAALLFTRRWLARQRAFAVFFHLSDLLPKLVTEDKASFRRHMATALGNRGFVLSPAKVLKHRFQVVGQLGAMAVHFTGTDDLGRQVLVRCIQNKPTWQVTAREIRRFLAVVTEQPPRYGVMVTTAASRRVLRRSA